MPDQMFPQPSSYKIQKILSQTQKSLVYLARRSDDVLEIHQSVVIKVFKQQIKDLPVLQMESLLRARHSSHLVKVLGFERFASQPALILEYIHGLNVKQFMEKVRLCEEEKNCICSQVLTGLKELKKIGLAHGDLSLENILIDTKGQVYLTDYGLANYEDEIYGTQPFIAPEISFLQKPNFSSDLFSLGVLEKILIGSFSETEIIGLSNQHFFLEGNSLLDPISQKRKPISFPFSPETKSLLGNQVQQALLLGDCFHSKKNSFPSKEQTLYRRGKKRAWRTVFFTGFFLFSLFITNPFISDKEDSEPAHPSTVLIRTKQWVHVQLAGQTAYSPSKFSLNRPGIYQLQWKKNKSRGQKKIFVRNGETIILRDHDFQ